MYLTTDIRIIKLVSNTNTFFLFFSVLLELTKEQEKHV